MDARHRQILIVTGVLSALVFGIVTMVLSSRASAAVRERDRALEVTRFLVEQFHLEPSRLRAGESVTAREVLDAGTRRIEDGGLGLPQDRPAVSGVLGSAYLGLGLYREAERLLQWSLSLRAESPSGPDRVINLLDLAVVHAFEGHCEQADRLRAEAAGLVEEGVGGARLTRYLDDRAFSLNNRMGHPGMAESLYRLALVIKLRRFGEDHVVVARARQNLAVALELQSKYDEAAQHLERALQVRKTLHGEDSMAAARTLNALAAAKEMSTKASPRPVPGQMCP